MVEPSFFIVWVIVAIGLQKLLCFVWSLKDGARVEHDWNAWFYGALIGFFIAVTVYQVG